MKGRAFFKTWSKLDRSPISSEASRNVQTQRTSFNSALAIALAYFIINATGEFQTSFHGGDDWYLHTEGAANRILWYASTEGRWLNYPWALVTPHLTPEMTYAIYIALYAFSILNLVHGLAAERIFPLIYLALFFSPLAVHNSGYTVSCPAMLVFFLTTLVVRKTPSPQMAVLTATIGQTLSLLTYPAVAPVILLQLASKSATHLTRMAFCFATFLLSFLLAAFIMCSANYFVNGEFSVPISEWRHPNPGTSIAALTENSLRFFHDITLLVKKWPHALLIILITCLIGVADPGARRLSLAIVAAVALILSVELLLSLITGTVVPERARFWLWIAPVLLCASGLTNADYFSARVALSFIIVVYAVMGIVFWISYYSSGQRSLQFANSLIMRAKQLQSIPQQRAIYFGEYNLLPELKRFGQGRGFADYAYAKYGMLIEKCAGQLCDDIQSSAVREMVFVHGDTIVFRISSER